MQGVPLSNGKMLWPKICLFFSMLPGRGSKHFSHYSSLLLDPLQQNNSRVFFSFSYHLLSSLPQEESPHFNKLYSSYDYPKPFLHNDAVNAPRCVFFISLHITEREGTQTSTLCLRGANLVWNPLKRTAVRHGWMP